MNMTPKTSLLLVVMLSAVMATGILSCNNNFPPSKPATSTYGDSLWQIDHFITNKRAIELIGNFKANKDGITNGKFNGNSKLLFDHETFNLRDIASLIKTKGCIGLRINMGLDENNQARLVLVAVDANGKEIIENVPADLGRTGAGGGTSAPPAGKNYVEDGQRWP